MPSFSESRLLLSPLKELGLLLQQDKILPNAVTILAGETLAGSWWSHPRARVIFRCLGELADHPDVLQTKLVSGKVTFVHRRLWPMLLAVASAHETWQLDGLSKAAKRLLDQLETRRELRASGAPVKEIERRLLAHGEQVHTRAGRHETRLETWKTWSKRARCRSNLTANEGRYALEEAVRLLGGVGGELPWQKSRSRRAR